MAHLRMTRLPQALPFLYKTCPEQITRTKLPALPICQLRLARASASLGACQRTMATTTTSRSTAGPVAPGHARDDVIFAAGQPSDLPARALNLLSQWRLSASRRGITRHYAFGSFAKAWEFMSAVAHECKLRQHHPSWSNSYNKVTIEWTTHKPQGLSIKDVEMAEFCDRCAADIGLNV